MTDAMIFFQSIFMFKNFTPIRINKAEIELASSLRHEARTLAATAAEEMQSGRTTQALAFEAGADKNKSRIFAEITVWHNSRAADKYRKSAARFEEAGKIQIAKRKALTLMAKEMMRSAVKAEAGVKQMNDFLTQN